MLTRESANNLLVFAVIGGLPGLIRRWHVCKTRLGSGGKLGLGHVEDIIMLEWCLIIEKVVSLVSRKFGMEYLVFLIFSC